MTTKTEALKLALEALKPVSTYGRVGSRDTDTAKAQQAIAAIREALAEKSSGTEQPTEFLSSFQTEKLAIERGIEWTPAIHDLCNRAIEEEKLAEQPALPFGIGGGLVAIKTLLSRDPCAHAKVAIEMIDAMLAEHMEDNLTMVEQPCTYPNCPYPCPSLPDCRDAEQPAQQQEPVSAIRALTDQCAALIQERDELQKQVWRYEKNGVTCQTYRHKIDRTCSECNVQEDYTSPQPAQQEPVATGKQFLQVEELLKDMLDTLPYNSPDYWISRIKEVLPLYTSPQPAQQQYQSTADKCELTPVPAKGGLLPAQQQEPVASLLVGQDSDGRYVSITAKAHADTLPPGEYKLYTSQTTIPQGWRLVPVEPTMNMIFAMRRTDTYGDAWTEALNAAPQPQGEQK